MDSSCEIQAGRLVVPSREVMRRVVSLPAPARRNLREALSYEIDRLLPLGQDDIYFGFERLRGHRKSGKLECALWAVKRRTVDEALAEVALGRRRVDSVHLLDLSADPPSRLPLVNVPLPRRAAFSWPPSWGFVGLQAALLGLLAAAWLYVPVLQHQTELERLQAQLEVVAEDVREVRKLEAAIMARLEEEEALYRRAYGQVGGTALLEDITTRLPDGDWLTGLQWDAQGLRLSGFSEDATALVAALERSELFENVRLDGPVTVEPATGKDRFTISLQRSSPTP